METEKVESEKKKASPRVRFVRIYTPFIISVATCIKYNFSSIHKVG